jgi:hypothetical protein
MTGGRFCTYGTFLAGLLDYEQARNMFLSCPLVLVIALNVNVQSGPAVGVAHELQHDLYLFALLDQERCKRMPEGMPAHVLCDPRPDCSRTKLSLQRRVEP